MYWYKLCYIWMTMQYTWIHFQASSRQYEMVQSIFYLDDDIIPDMIYFQISSGNYGMFQDLFYLGNSVIHLNTLLGIIMSL